LVRLLFNGVPRDEGDPLIPRRRKGILVIPKRRRKNGDRESARPRLSGLLVHYVQDRAQGGVMEFFEGSSFQHDSTGYQNRTSI